MRLRARGIPGCASQSLGWDRLSVMPQLRPVGMSERTKCRLCPVQMSVDGSVTFGSQDRADVRHQWEHPQGTNTSCGPLGERWLWGLASWRRWLRMWLTAWATVRSALRWGGGRW
jgi:hypothetical protein